MAPKSTWLFLLISVSLFSLSLAQNSDEGMTIQKQIYVVSGTLGGLILLVLILLLAMALSLQRVKDQLKNRYQRYIPSDEINNSYAVNKGGRPGEQIHAYDNTAFSGGGLAGVHEMEERRPDSKAEVERLGYEMYNGKAVDKRYSGAPLPRVLPDRMSRDSHQLRLEDGVVPMGPAGGGNGTADRRDYRRGVPATNAAAATGDRYRY